MWRALDGTWHAILHADFDRSCNGAAGVHAYSPDGVDWRASEHNAFGNVVALAEAAPLTQYYSAARQSHYLSHGCAGCPRSTYVPLRVEGFGATEPCAPSLGCVQLDTLFNADTRSNLVVPRGWGPLPAGYAPFGAVPPLFALPLSYGGAASTAVLELWSGRAAAGGPLDFVTLANATSRAEALAAGYVKVAELARVLTAAEDAANPGLWSSWALCQRERPHLILQGGVPTHLTSGVNACERDRTFTYVQPIAQQAEGGGA